MNSVPYLVHASLASLYSSIWTTREIRHTISLRVRFSLAQRLLAMQYHLWKWQSTRFTQRERAYPRIGNFQIAAEPIEEYIPTISSHYQTHFLLPSTSLTLVYIYIYFLSDWQREVLRWFYDGRISKPGIEPGIFGLDAGILPLRLLRYGNRNLVVAGNGGNIFSNGLSGGLEISNCGMSRFPLREPGPHQHSSLSHKVVKFRNASPLSFRQQAKSSDSKSNTTDPLGRSQWSDSPTL